MMIADVAVRLAMNNDFLLYYHLLNFTWSFRWRESHIYFVIIERIYILCLIIIIKSEVWTVTHCLGLGHETMVCAVCLSIFLWHWSCPKTVHMAGVLLLRKGWRVCALIRNNTKVVSRCPFQCTKHVYLVRRKIAKPFHTFQDILSEFNA